MSDYISPLLGNPHYERLLAEEGLVFHTLDTLCEFMERQGVTRAELARRLGTSRANITQLLRGRNVTLRTVAAAFHVLGGELELRVRVVQEPEQAPSPMPRALASIPITTWRSASAAQYNAPRRMEAA